VTGGPSPFPLTLAFFSFRFRPTPSIAATIVILVLVLVVMFAVTQQRLVVLLGADLSSLHLLELALLTRKIIPLITDFLVPTFLSALRHKFLRLLFFLQLLCVVLLLFFGLLHQ